MWSFETLLQGYPGRSPDHGALGWASIGLFRLDEHIVLTDPGSYHCRSLLIEGLDKRGLRCEDITAILLTHLHWDHSCNYPLFPNARIFLTAKELEWAASKPPKVYSLPEFHVDRLLMEQNVRLIEAFENPLLPGIAAFPTPGHTPGHCVYAITTSNGLVLVTGDAAKNRWELMTGEVESTMNSDESRRSIERIVHMAETDPSSRILCGHDGLLRYSGGFLTTCEALRAHLTVRLGDATASPLSIDLSTVDSASQ